MEATYDRSFSPKLFDMLCRRLLRDLLDKWKAWVGRVIYMLICPVSIVVLEPLPILLSMLSDGSINNGRTESESREGMASSFSDPKPERTRKKIEIYCLTVVLPKLCPNRDLSTRINNGWELWGTLLRRTRENALLSPGDSLVSVPGKIGSGLPPIHPHWS